jgi:hypothetical protein
VPAYPIELENIVMRALKVDPDERYQSAGEMGAELEAYARACGHTLGHTAITETMTQLFSARRRRFARSSADVHSDPSDPDITPIVPMDDLVTPPEPVHAVEHDETTVPTELPTPPPLPPAPQIRFRPLPDMLRTLQPSPFSGTALVRRAAPPQTLRPWWIAIGVFVLAILIAILR